MESGYAFLHPRNILQSPSSISIETEYAPIPFSPWRPCIPFIESRSPAAGWAPLLLRWARVTWVFVTLPSWIGFALFMHCLPSRLTSGVGFAIWPRRKSWTLWQKLTYPVLARLVWAITFGLPPAQSPVTESGIPLLARLWYGRGTDMQPVDLAFSSKEDERRWIRDEATDPSRKIVLQKRLAGFWIRSKRTATSSISRPAAKAAAAQPEVVLYLVGGGYITGHPLEASRVFDIARMTSLPVLGVNYPKSVTSQRAFPAPLQDVISAYAFLLRKGYKRIALAGDSAGAGLGLALMQYLSRMALAEGADMEERIVLPCKACFYSPWADLTFSHDYKETVHLDIIHPTMLAVAAAAYTSGLRRYSVIAGETESIGTMQRAHPFFSPALPSAVPSLSKISEAAKLLKQPLPSFLIVTGTAELFSAECDSLDYNLRKAGLPVEELNVEDEVHGPPLMPTFMSDKIKPTLDRIRDFLLSP